MSSYGGGIGACSVGIHLGTDQQTQNMQISVRLVVLAASLGLPLAGALECSSHDVLKKYQLDKYSSQGSVERQTPPSTTKDTWWINPCIEHSKDLEIPSNCKDNDMLCGVTEVKVPDRDGLVTQIIDFPNSLAYSVDETDNQLTLTLKGAKWGSSTVSAKIMYECRKNNKNDEIVSTQWEDQQVVLQVRGPSGCLKDNSNDGGNNSDNNDKNGNDNNNDKKSSGSSGLSWFTWLIVYAFLFTVIYLMIVSYMSTRGGSFDDFRGEFVERGSQFVTSLPTFCKEVAMKLFGQSSSSQRGGYSAV